MDTIIEIINAHNFISFLQDIEKEDGEDFSKEIAFFNSIAEGAKVSTLEEYFDLIDTISEYTDGGYEIFNCGRTIIIG